MAATRTKVTAKDEEISDSDSESEEQDDFLLDDVLKLGGNKGDYNTLRMIDETQDVMELQQEEGSDVEPDEIKAIIQKLGLDKIKAPSGNRDDENEGLSETSNNKQEEEEDMLMRETKEDPADVQVSEVSSSSQPQEQKKPQGKFIIAPGDRWYQAEFPTDPTTWPTVNPTSAQQLKREAAKLFEQEVKQHNQLKNKRKSSDFGWLKTVATAGTLSDRVAGLTVLIQDAPLHNLASLETLVNMAKKKMRREATQAVDTLKELWLSDLLPDGRKLKMFEQHPLSILPEITSGNQEGRRRRLIMWYYEDRVKQLYAEFISAIQTLAHDTVATNKSKALVDIHPNMRIVVVREVERLLYRPNVSTKAQYYSMCFLNQLVLDHDSSELANKLVTIYFSFFKVYVQKKEKDTKMLSALLTGVNRAFPYADVKDEKVDTQINELFKVVHAVNFNISVQLANHFHPSVALFAKKILDGEAIQYSGDPLQDFTLARFLDRFVFRNPKQRKQDPGQSVMQPKSTRFEPRGVKRFPEFSYDDMDEMSFSEEENDDEDEAVGPAKQGKKKAANKRKAGEDDGDDDEGVDFVAAMATKPKRKRRRGKLPGVGSGSMFAAAEEINAITRINCIVLNVHSELTRNKRKGKKRKGQEEESDDDDELEDEDEMMEEDDDDDGEVWGEEEEDGEEDGEEAGVFMDPAEEDMFADAPGGSDEEFSYDDMDEMSFSEEENDDEDEAVGPAKQGKKKAANKRKAGDDGDDDDEGVDFVAAMATKPKRKRRRGKLPGVGSGSMFAAAEEFSSLLDDNAGSKFDNIGIGALSNKDNADAKQLKWEVARDQWVRGQNWKEKKRNRGKGPVGKGRGKKQGGKQGKRRR
uniref:CCAAT-binding factor domain-containing protein n=1 Tax=Branchiostoma floridae TaxID=7739 RepID=C3XRL2_BRAFL|eukprot:XP_002613321.1 hypothetical protein BRAFLDRAFT_68288 [Branchiostoma floridae]